MLGMNQAQKAVVERIQHHVPLHEKRVLEVGCGNGRLTAGLAPMAQSMVAIDPDEVRLAQAQAAIPGVDFLVGSGESLAFADKSFDVVLFLLSLHHQESIKALQEAYRVVRPEGTALVVEICGDGQFEQLCRLFHDESQQQKAAQQAIGESPFTRIHQETLRTEWVFENKEALCSGLSTYYDAPLTTERTTQITTIMGESLQAQPVIVEELLYVACLQK